MQEPEPPNATPGPEQRKDGHPVAIIGHLSGRYRGKIQRLEGDRLRIGIGEDAEVRFSVEDLTPGLSELPPSGPYAVLERRGDTYELIAALEADIWVNGARVEQRVLDSGDVLEIGEGGPVLRFRLYPPGSRAFKSVSEVFSDCAEFVRRGRSATDRAGVILTGPPTELLTRTSPLVRGAAFGVIVVLAAAVGLLWHRSRSLERQLQAETDVVRGLTQLLERSRAATPSERDVEAIRDELSRSVARIDTLEARSEARARVIAESARSVVFVQGGWGFEDPSHRPLRFAKGAPESVKEPPDVTLDGDGPPVEIFYTGTAFVVSPDGQLLTNRHVARPWDFQAPVELLEEHGLTPVIRRFLGYLPGVAEPFELELVRASDTLDVALLRGSPGDAELHPLALAGGLPRPGDEVVVLGYPAGIEALLARADPGTLDAIREAGPLDFWTFARRLSDGGMIQPLATAGVVGQITPTSVVYDAETTHGGSGGPVLNLDGEVLAVNTAILPQFGGSNIGVPASAALRLLQETEQEEGEGGTR